MILQIYSGKIAVSCSSTQRTIKYNHNYLYNEQGIKHVQATCKLNPGFGITYTPNVIR